MLYIFIYVYIYLYTLIMRLFLDVSKYIYHEVFCNFFLVKTLSNEFFSILK